MPSGYETYKIYLSLKRHFTQDSYDFHKYNGQSRTSVEAYQKRRDTYQFEKLGKKYPKEKLIDLFVSNFVNRSIGWIGDALSETAEEVYTEWLARTESLSYKFKEECSGMLDWLSQKGLKFNDLFKVNGSDHPIIVKMAAQSVLSLETYCVLDGILGFGVRLNKRLDDPVWRDFYMRTRKYGPFLQYDSKTMKSALKTTIDENYPELI